MDQISEFIYNKCYFGSFPVQSTVDELESEHFKYFIDLTYSNESKIKQYKTKHTYINYPILDHKAPSEWKSFAKFIIQISNIINDLGTGEKIYIHCKGGHGRSGVVVACLLCYIYKLTPLRSIEKTTECHNKRKGLKVRWKRLGSPQTKVQKIFVANFFKKMFVFHESSNYFSSVFNINSTKYSVEIPGYGIYPNISTAFNSLIHISISGIRLTRYQTLVYICNNIISQNEYLMKTLLNTGLRPIIDKHSPNLGKAWMEIRDTYYLK